MNEPLANAPRQRLDKWLWFARVVKTRTLAQKLVHAGDVRVNSDKQINAAYALKVGDVLTIKTPRQIRILEVLAPGEKRQSAPLAAQLYADHTPPPPPKAEKIYIPPKPALREKGSGRPTKKERRETENWRATARNSDSETQ